MNIEKVKSYIKNKNIIPLSFREHTKASEKYIDVKIHQENNFIWTGSIPYFYRRTGLFINSEQQLAEYLDKIYIFFNKNNIEKWVKQENEYWKNVLQTKKVTKAFFFKLLNMKWNSVRYDLPKNPNWARRIQDIKEIGYTIVTHTKMKVVNKKGNDTHLLLLPLPRGTRSGYESFSSEFRKKIIKILNVKNIYELSSANKSGLIVDHKFPEIRWDEKTKSENIESISEDEIKKRFQLLDNQRNQQKREKCRECFQTNKRGILFGINYYYEGDENWEQDIPKMGKDAERGCVGCGWYDVEKWRNELNNLLKNYKC